MWYALSMDTPEGIWPVPLEFANHSDRQLVVHLLEQVLGERPEDGGDSFSIEILRDDDGLAVELTYSRS